MGIWKWKICHKIRKRQVTVEQNVKSFTYVPSILVINISSLSLFRLESVYSQLLGVHKLISVLFGDSKHNWLRF